MDEQPSGFAEELPNARTRRNGWGEWRGEQAKPARGKLVALTLITLLGVAGAIGGLIFWLQQPPESNLISFSISEYGQYWPVHAWAERDAEQLAGLYETRYSKSFALQQIDKLRSRLEWLAATPGAADHEHPANAPKRALLIHVSCFAFANEQGIQLIVPKPDSTQFESSYETLSLEELLNYVRQCSVPRKLLLLDIAKPKALPFSGLLLDDTAAVLGEALRRRLQEKDLPCSILTSCGPGQHSHSCDVEQMSVFAFYVREALRGRADGVIDGRRDGLVQTAEFVRFVQARVDRWVRTCRGGRQTPIFYEADDNRSNDALSLVRELAEESNPVIEPSSYPKELVDAWNDLLAVRTRQPSIAHSKAIAKLHRAEAYWSKSGRSDLAENEWRAAGQLIRSGKLGSYRSKANDDDARRLAARFRILPNLDITAELSDKLKSAWDALLLAQGPEEAKALANWRALAAEQPAQAAWIIWQHALALERPDRKDFLRAVQQLRELKAVTAETLLLEKLAAVDFEDVLARPPREAFAALLQAEAVFGKVACLPSSGFSMFEQELHHINEKRRGAEARLFAAKSLAETELARQILKEVAIEAEAIVRRINLRAQAHEALFRSGSLLLDLLTTSVETDWPPYAEWKRLASLQVSILNQMQQQKDSPSLSDAIWSSSLVELERLTEEILSKLRPEAIQSFIARKPTEWKNADIQQVERLLLTSCISGDHRSALWAMRNEGLGKLHGMVREMDRNDDQQGKRIPTPQPMTTTNQYDWPMQRAEAGIILLQMAGIADLSDVGLMYKNVQQNPTDRSAWQRLGVALRSQWLEIFPAKVAAAAAQGDRTGFSRLASALPPEVARLNTIPDHLDLATNTELRAHQRWILKQLEADSELRSRSEQARQFYDRVRSELAAP